MAPRSRDLEEDDQLHTMKKVSLEKSFEEVKQASFDRTDSHDLYSKFTRAWMSVEELQKQAGAAVPEPASHEPAASSPAHGRA